MSQQNDLEKRVAQLEADVAELKRRLQVPAESPSEVPGELPEWIKRISGRMKDYPEFEEVLRLGREIRQADRPPEDTP
jgi:hypothetical protein